MAKNKITGIVVQRTARAYASGLYFETIVYVLRENSESAARYSTNPILGDGKISEDSVRRAERAQHALVERAENTPIE